MKNKLLLSLLICGLLFSCNGKNIESTQNTENEENTEPAKQTNFEEDEQGLSFFLQDDGTYAVAVGTAGCLSTIVVPTTHNGKNVTRVMNKGFSSENDYASEFKFKKVILPEGIKEIGESAFGGSTLEHIILPKSVEKICEFAFECDNLVLLESACTFEEFKNIEFETRWMETGKKNELKLKFTDKEFNYISMFDRTKIWTYIGYSNSNYFEYDEQNDFRRDVNDSITITLGGGRDFYFQKYSSQFKKLPCGWLDLRVTIEDTNIVKSTSQGSIGSFGITPYLAGSTTVTVTEGDFSQTFTCVVVDCFEISIPDAIAILTSLGRGVLCERYLMRGFAHFVTSNNTDYIYIRESIDASREFATYFRQESKPSITDNMSICVIGRLSTGGPNIFTVYESYYIYPDTD